MSTTGIHGKIERLATVLLGLAFSGHFIRFMWLNAPLRGAGEPRGYSPEAALQLVGSPAWIFTGAMHLLAGVAIAALALSSTRTKSAYRSLAGTAAIIGGGCFLILSMSHFQGLSEIESAQRWCAADGHTTLLTYNLLRVVALGSGMFALGAFLLLRSIAQGTEEARSRIVAWVGCSAGLLCIFYVFARSPSSLVTALALAGVVAWSSGQLIAARRHGS